MLKSYCRISKLSQICIKKCLFSTQPSTGTFSSQQNVNAQTETPFADESFMSTSFEGASKEPFDSKILDKLELPLDPNDVEVKPDGLLYYPGIIFLIPRNQV